jgi:hypothetical protein
MRIDGSQTEYCGRAMVAPCRRVEKPENASNLREERRREPARVAALAHRASLAHSSRSETRFRGETVNSGIESRFAAQVLGQMLETRRANPVLAARAYAHGNRGASRGNVVRVL